MSRKPGVFEQTPGFFAGPTYIRILAQQGCPGHVLNSTTYCKVGRERAWVLGSQDRMELLWELVNTFHTYVYSMYRTTVVP